MWGGTLSSPRAAEGWPGQRLLSLLLPGTAAAVPSLPRDQQPPLRPRPRDAAPLSCPGLELPAHAGAAPHHSCPALGSQSSLQGCPCPSLPVQPGTDTWHLQALFPAFLFPFKGSAAAVVSGHEAGLLWVSRACAGLVSGLVRVPGAVAAPGRAQGSQQVSRLILAACRARPGSSRALAHRSRRRFWALAFGKVLVEGLAGVAEPVPEGNAQHAAAPLIPAREVPEAPHSLGFQALVLGKVRGRMHGGHSPSRA